jgi:hypothetical protein
MRPEVPVLLDQENEPGGSVGEEVALDIYFVRRAPEIVPAVLVLLRLPRPFRKLRGELPVLSELSSNGFAFFAVLPALIVVILRRLPVMLWCSVGLRVASVRFAVSSCNSLDHSCFLARPSLLNPCLDLDGFDACSAFSTASPSFPEQKSFSSADPG